MNPYDPQPPETIKGERLMVLHDRVLRPNPLPTLFEWFLHFHKFGSTCSYYQHGSCWGATILRVSYDDDQLFARAVRAIRRLMIVKIPFEYEKWLELHVWQTDHPLEPLPAEWDFSASHPSVNVPFYTNQYREIFREHTEIHPPRYQITLADVVSTELRRMHHNIIIEDRSGLDGADPAAAWMYHHKRFEQLDKRARGGFFVYLDKESIERLASVPDDEALAAMTMDEQAAVAWENWVKIIDVSGYIDPEDDADDAEELGISPIPWRRRRLRLGNWFEFIVETAECYMDEASLEGAGHHRGRPSSPEWTFSPADHFLFSGKEERMKALYGPRVLLVAECSI